MAELEAELWKWARNLPTWQQHLVAALATKSELTEEEYQKGFAALLSAHGVGELPDRLTVLSRDHFAGPRSDRVAPRLLSLGSFHGVNALAEDQRLEFEPDGLTVIYGENAAGKTGYVRPLKRVGRCVAHEGQILHNVFEQPPPRSTVKVEIRQGSATRAFEVDLAADPPRELASLSVFDARCADNYVARGNVIAFTPDPLLVFDRLAKVQMGFRDRINQRCDELLRTEPDLAEFAATTAGRALRDGLESASEDDLRRRATCSEAERRRAAELREQLATVEAGNAGARAAELGAEAARLDALVDALSRLDRLVNPEATARLADLRSRADAAEQAARAAREGAFAGLPVAGVGSEAWRTLWEAARRFHEHEASPGKAFPPIEHGERCPLCLQALDEEARGRFARFEQFVHSTVTAEAVAARQELNTVSGGLSDDLVAACRSETLGTLRTADPELHRRVEAFVEERAIRLKALREGGRVDEHIRGTDPRSALVGRAQRLRMRGAELREFDGDQATPLRAEFEELSARMRLGERLNEILTWKAALAEHAALRQAHAALETTSITRTQRTLAQRVVTARLEQAIRVELRNLGLTHIRVEPIARGERGATVIRLRLQGLGAASQLPAVLSEGEQRAVALAFFLAEVSAGDHDGGIALDDPVSSLDHGRRIAIAERLCAEARHRQVIVFTHDLFFLHYIMRTADGMNLPLRIQTVWRSGDTPGRTSPDAPWAALGATARVRRLRDQLQNFPKENDVGPERYASAVKQWYESLRETWERAVEQELLYGVVERFQPAVQTKRLDGVLVTPARVAVVEEAMTKCSSFAHDSPLAGSVPLPDRAGMLSDLEALDQFLRDLSRERERR